MEFAGLSGWAVIASLAASAALLAALHLLRVRPRPIRVVTNIFWSHAIERTRARTLLERFRHPKTYALLLLIAGLLVLALGKPVLTAGADREATIYVLDAGLSMAATTDGQSRLNAAVAAMLADSAGMSANEPLAVIVADPWPRVIQRMDDPRPVLRGRLNRLEPASLPAARADAVALARTLLGQREGSITLISDRPLEGTARDAAVRVLQVGDAVANTSVLAAFFEPDASDPLKGTLQFRVAWWGEGQATTRVTVRRAGGAVLDDREVAFTSSGATLDLLVPGLAADGERIEISLGDDAVAADNRVMVRLPVRRLLRVAWPQEPSPVLEPLRIALDELRLIERVSPQQPHDLAVVLGTANESNTPQMIIEPVAAQAFGQRVTLLTEDSGLAAGLDWEAASVPAGPGLSASGDVLIAAGSDMLAALRDSSVVLSARLLDAESTAWQRPAFAVLISRIVAHLARWSDQPIALMPEEAIARPDLAGLEGITILRGSRVVSNVYVSDSSTPDPEAAQSMAWPELWEWLVGLALLLGLVEGVLHTRGRIS